jgi:O-succinylbenzoic acid--CoA ligase
MGEVPWLLARAAATPDASALRLPERELSWSELAREARGIETNLARAGVGPDDVVATLLGSGDFARTLHAVWMRGATLLPLNLRLTASEIVFQLRDAGARFLVHGRDALAAHARDAVSELGELILLHPEAAPGPPACEAAPLDRDAPLAILYTSGTTGHPKGAILSAGNFEASANASRDRLGSQSGDRCLACLPLSHVGGLSNLVRSLLIGSCVQVQEGFDPPAVARALEEDGITDVSFVANMLDRVLDERGALRAPSALRTVLVGGGPLPEPLLDRCHALGWPVAPTYGLTEAASQVATRSPDDAEAHGLRPLPGVELRIDHANEGSAGEILVRGPNVMQGYLGRPEDTARALRSGWLHTGDVGRLHPDGTLTVLDRRRDLIVSGGENVYPAEVESVLSGHPGVAEVGVAGRPDARFGSRPVAWFVAKPGHDPSEQELIAFCRTHLAAFKTPVACVRVEALPRTSSGKLVRARLGENPGDNGA